MLKLNASAKVLLILLILGGLILSYSSCSKNVAPVAPDDKLSISTKDYAAKPNFQILKFDNVKKSLKKEFYVSQYFPYETGGTINLAYQLVKIDSGFIDVSVSLQILPYAMTANADISMLINDAQFFGDFDVVFDPHGTIFSTPALLNIHIKGMDLGIANPNDFKLYYVNEDTGEWELMVCESITVNLELGEIIVVNGQLPHFSRYALSTG